MAGLTIPKRWCLMRIINLVAAKTILGRRSQSIRRLGARMAIGAGQVGMQSSQWESQARVVKIGAISIDAIVAGQAALAERSRVRGHEIRLNLAMAYVTNFGIETANILNMAIMAVKRLPIASLLMPGQ